MHVFKRFQHALCRIVLSYCLITRPKLPETLNRKSVSEISTKCCHFRCRSATVVAAVAWENAITEAAAHG